MSNFTSALRVALATMTLCVAGYTALVLTVAQLATPGTANGSLISRDDGGILGSRQIAQGFSQPRYIWPRPSAAGYDAGAAGGSNLSPANPVLTARAEARIAAEGGAGPTNPIPADLVTASGSGLDPHVTVEAALFQAGRVAEARRVPRSAVTEIVAAQAEPTPLSGARRVNVLALNLALDAALAAPAPRQ
ncbi:potassium-transporting ATPase subunit C (plasmid) [Salipiger sp. H15]|uniref:Potassium-transporting ATPase KdpC subunit n=1 Tax=Alloyangia sp. H15 TaxID=3029062 RepID=A0AAU8ASM3_9RHOB